MTTPRVSREQAELLKKVGYDVDLPGMKLEYIPCGEPIEGYEVLLFPTLDEAARWLREVKGWHCYADSSREWCTWYPVVVPKGGSFDTGTDGFDTHDLALSAGIDLILKKLDDGTE